MAMKVVHYHWKKILPDHWIRTAGSVGIHEEVTCELLENLITAVDDVIGQTIAGLPDGFPSSVSGPIFEGLQTKSAWAKRML